jgi:hypothetical protein
MQLAKYSFGVGDRFAHEGAAQLQAIIDAKNIGIDIVPVWNKSNREHEIIHSKPIQARNEADNAVKKLNWQGDYYVDADHINLNNVGAFIDACDFFTLDVADYINKPSSSDEISEFIKLNKKYLGELNIPGIAQPFKIDETLLTRIARKFLFAIKQAQKIYQHIKQQKNTAEFIAEISMDEVDEPQTPVELFFILSSLAHLQLPLQTIAPKFTGRFNKGVDYVGDLNKFAQEFEQDLLVIAFAIKEFGLPQNLKLSVHSGSDKFSIYPIMGKLIKKYNQGIHIKTAGTTWLEEIIGLALAGDEALDLAKNIYQQAFERREELCRPYAAVIDIDIAQLPSPNMANNWNKEQFANALRHIPNHPEYNPNMRQLMHVGYKIAAEFGKTYTDMLQKYSAIIGQQVTTNIFERHIKRLFPFTNL